MIGIIYMTTTVGTCNKRFLLIFQKIERDYKILLLILYDSVSACLIYTVSMQNKFSNCFVWASPSTSDLTFNLLS